jgi:hypothetical protein
MRVFLSRTKKTKKRKRKGEEEEKRRMQFVQFGFSLRPSFTIEGRQTGFTI